MHIIIDTVMDEVTEFYDQQRAFSLPQVERLLEGGGFARIESFRELAGNPANAAAFGVFLCRKAV